MNNGKAPKNINSSNDICAIAVIFSSGLITLGPVILLIGRHTQYDKTRDYTLASIDVV